MPSASQRASSFGSSFYYFINKQQQLSARIKCSDVDCDAGSAIKIINYILSVRQGQQAERERRRESGSGSGRKGRTFLGFASSVALSHSLSLSFSCSHFPLLPLYFPSSFPCFAFASPLGHYQRHLQHLNFCINAALASLGLAGLGLAWPTAESTGHAPAPRYPRYYPAISHCNS